MYTIGKGLVQVDFDQIHQEVMSITNAFLQLELNSESDLGSEYLTSVFQSCHQTIERVLALIPHAIHMTDTDELGRRQLSKLKDLLIDLHESYWPRGLDSEPIPIDELTKKSLKKLKDELSRYSPIVIELQKRSEFAAELRQLSAVPVAPKHPQLLVEPLRQNLDSLLNQLADLVLGKPLDLRIVRRINRILKMSVADIIEPICSLTGDSAIQWTCELFNDLTIIRETVSPSFARNSNFWSVAAPSRSVLDAEFQEACRQIHDLRVFLSNHVKLSKSDVAKAQNLRFDDGTFTVFYVGIPCELGNTLEYHLLKRLSLRPGISISNEMLKQDVWKDDLTSKATIQQTAKNLRRHLKESRIKGIVIDGTKNSGHYILTLQ